MCEQTGFLSSCVVFLGMFFLLCIATAHIPLKHLAHILPLVNVRLTIEKDAEVPHTENLVELFGTTFPTNCTSMFMLDSESCTILTALGTSAVSCVAWKYAPVKNSL